MAYRRDRSATWSGATTAPPLDPQVLATRDGQHFRVAARLPVPVRYAGTAAAAAA